MSRCCCSGRVLPPQGVPRRKTRAAVAWQANAPPTIETVDLQGPKAGEVLVEVQATAICHTEGYTLVADHLRLHAPQCGR